MIWAVIMAGGAGTRFWPMSRKKRPKQLLPIVSKRTMIEETAARLAPLVSPKRILIITQADQQPAIRKLLKKIPRENIIAEPCPRNTAPCLALAALHIEKKDPNAVFAALPADHLIRDTAFFRAHLKVACNEAAAGRHVVFGIPPSIPHTGYGYIESGSKIRTETEIEIFKGLRFVEKPSLDRAKSFVEAGNYYWNSGMFVWKVSFFLKELERAIPDMKTGIAAIRPVLGTRREAAVLRRFFPKFPSVSIDYGLMEKAADFSLVKARYDWNDVGSWLELEKISKLDEDGNCLAGNAVSLDSRGNIVKSGKRLLAILGVENLIIVDSDDALLVAHKDKAQDIRKLVEELARRKLRQYL